VTVKSPGPEGTAGPFPFEQDFEAGGVYVVDCMTDGLSSIAAELKKQ